MIKVRLELIPADGAKVDVLYSGLPPNTRSVLEGIQQALEIPRRIKDENPVTYLKSTQTVLMRDYPKGPWSIECKDLGGETWYLDFCRSAPNAEGETIWRPSRFEREDVL